MYNGLNAENLYKAIYMFIVFCIYIINLSYIQKYIKWAASWQNQQNGMCAQWILWSAWASAQSDQSSLSA